VLHLKDLHRKSIGERLIASDGKILEKRKGLHGGRALFAGTEKSCRLNDQIIAYWYSMSRIILSTLDGAG
jgi:hypothetical protein